MLLRLTNNVSTYTDLPLAWHIHKRTEKFIYRKAVDNLGVPLVYCDAKDINAKANLSLIDKSWTLSANSPQRTFASNAWVSVTGESYTSSYSDVLITDQYLADGTGNLVPLWYSLAISSTVINVKIEKITPKGRELVKFGYLFTSGFDRIYTNFTNRFDPVSGWYEIYYLTVYDSDGTIGKGLIDPVSAVRVAEWTDLDEDGLLPTNVSFYSRETNTDNTYTFYFNKGGTYYIKALPSSYIGPLKFNQNLPEDGWFPSFSVGSFSHSTTDGSYRYSVPEYADLSFIPSAPYAYDSYSPIETITKRLIYLGRNNTATTQTDRPLELIISKSDGTILYALTTKDSKSGTTYSGDITWNTSLIVSWDNEAGLVELGIDLDPTWDVRTSYYYVVKSLNYYATNLNPLYNDLVYNHYYVYYCKPDQTEQAIHHLLVRNDGIIVDTSDSAYKLLIDGSYNPDTVIGLYYRNSSYYGNDWTEIYSSTGINTYNYHVLAEISFFESERPIDIETIDVSVPMDKLSKSNYEAAVYRNPRLYHSDYAATMSGTEYPQRHGYVVRISRSLLEDYGGIFSEEEMKSLLYQYVPSGKYLLFEWDEELTIDIFNDSGITLTWPTLGVGFSYKVYRSLALDTGYELISLVAEIAYGSYSYTDSNVDPGKVYYYYVVPVKNSIDFPHSNKFGIEAR